MSRSAVYNTPVHIQVGHGQCHSYRCNDACLMNAFKSSKKYKLNEDNSHTLFTLRMFSIGPYSKQL